MAMATATAVLLVAASNGGNSIKIGRQYEK
ncbi:MAG: hypothetical protein ACI8RD_003486 [Bacillariaceae sp.]|jgi:hypothetical protein